MKFSVVVLIAVFGVAALAADDDEIRQCTCDEMDMCWKTIHEEMKPCADKCKEGLTAPGLDPEEAKECFENKHDKDSCHKLLQSKMCAAEPNTFISKNETWQGRKTLKKDVENVLEDEPDHSKKLAGGWRHRHGHQRGRGGFFHFVKLNFGESGKQFAKCMKKCFKAKKNHSCIKNLGCGIKKLTKKEFRAHKDACKDNREQKKQALCDCLTNAGMQNVICEFGKKKSPESH
uniref:Uncharacterized protein n=1 Tax=Panagrolaimus sp. JU765 TaxID=591449 RepID=A0AC34QPI1_9BILA